MEKSKKNWLIGGGIAIGSLAAFLIGRHFYKKNMKALDETFHQNQDQIKKAGASPEKLDSELKEATEEEQFMKSLYTITRFNANFDVDAFNMHRCLSLPNVIHVRESDFRERKYLDFLFEIPNYVAGEKYMHGPRIADYIRQFSDDADYMWSKIVRYSREPICKLEGYIAVEFTNPDYNPEDPDSDPTMPKAFLLDKSVYSRFADERHDGLTKYYEALVRNELDEDDKEKLSEWIKQQIAEDLADKCSEDTEISFEFKYMFLTFKISFQLAKDEKDTGINLITASKCLEYLLNNCVVTKEGNRVEVPYRNVMIHAFNDDNVQDFNWYYTVDENGSVVPGSYFWD